MAEHASFSPSAAERWIACPASYLRSLVAPPEQPSEYAMLGTLAHEWAAKCISENLHPLKGYEGDRLDDEMLDAVALYVGIIRDLLKAEGIRWQGVEARVQYNDELFGTADFIAYIEDTLHVVDFKSGRGIIVDAKDNAQMMTYAWMAYWALRGTRPPSKIQLTIVQPLANNPMTTHTIDVAELLAWGSVVIEAMERAKNVEAEFVAGEHCRFCRVKPVCPELRGIVVKTANPIKHSDMTVEQVGEQLAKLDLAEQYIAAFREFAHTTATSGVTIPGWKLVPKRASRKWDSERTVKGICTKQGIAAYEERLLTPPALEKALGAIPEVLQKHITQESSGFNLVRDKSPRADSGAPTLTSALSKLQYRV